MALGNKGGFVRSSSILRDLRTGQTYVRMVESRRTALVMLLWFFLVSSAWVFNLNSRGVNHPHGDEWHTLILGTQNFGSFEEPVENARVGETNRWFVRLLHPAAIYYMNSHMGGEHYLTGWEYPGGYYLREHFDATDDIRDDPNIQDYVFFLRASFGVLAVLSFCMVMWALSGRFGIAAAATYGSLVLLHPIVFSQFDIFYSETTLFILFNTASFLCLRTQPLTTYRALVWSGVLSAAALSTKLTGILIIGPLFVQTVVDALRSRRNLKMGIEVYLLSAAAALVLLNLPSESLFSLLNETLANVYHFKTGHLVTEEGGVEFLRFIPDDMGYMLYMLPLLFAVSLFWLARRPRRGLAPVYVLGLLIIFVIWSFVNSSAYDFRNMASVYVAMSFIVALGAGSFVEGLKSKHKYVAAVCSGLVVVLMAGELVRHQYRMPSLVETFFERNVEQMRTCGTIGAIGLSEQALGALPSSQDGGITIGTTIFDKVEGPFNISEDPEVFDKYLQYDCLIVHRKGLSKHISNFVAPQHYQLADRVGNLFFFSREQQDQTTS